jgi:hypothetical protein
MTWFKDAPAVRGNPVAAYTAVLQKAGTPEGEVKSQAGVLMRQIMSGRSDWVEPLYDMTFSKLLTGDPETDGFTGEPSALLIEAVKGLAQGTALDAGMGQGRNAGYLAWFEHFLDDPSRPRPPAMQVLKLGQLRELPKGFRLDRYEEITALADWAGPDTPMVRAVAVKQ